MKLQYGTLCLSIVVLSACLCPVRAQERRTDNATPVTISSLPLGAISSSHSFVVAANGESFLFNLPAGVNRLPFLKNVYRPFGFSTDSRYFLYLKANGALPTFSLFAYDLSGGSERKVVEDRVFMAAWSPVSVEIALIAMDSGTDFRLMIHNLETGEMRQVNSGLLNPEHLEWSDDGMKLLYSIVTPVGDDYFHSGELNHTVREYDLRARTDGEAVEAVSDAARTGERAVQADINTALGTIQSQRRVISTASSPVGRFVTSTEGGSTVVRQWDKQSGRYVAISSGHIYAATREGVVIREFAPAGVEFRLATQEGIQPLMTFTASWKLPFQGTADLIQGGALFSGGACDGRVCNITSHNGPLGYGLDWQQRPAEGMGPARILAIEAGTVAAVVTNVTCNSFNVFCRIGWDNYASPCPSNGGAGNYVALAHPDGSFSFHAHMRSATSPLVVGQAVDQGAYLGDQGHSGSTGSHTGNYNSCGDHIHFQRQLSPAVWAQSIPTDFTELPCSLSCRTIYTSQNQETTPPATVSALTLNLIPSALAPGQSSPASRVILPTPAAAPGVTVMLSSSSSDVTVPASVTIPQGSTTAAFNLSIAAAATAGPITITAQQNTDTASAQLTIRTIQLFSVSSSPNPVLGGLGSLGEAVLSDPTPSGATVSLASAHSNATVPSTAIVPAGSSYVTFPISTSLTPVPVTADISATLNTLTHTVGLTINPFILTSVTVNGSSVTGGNTVFGNRVTLVAGAPAGGAVVTLTSSDPNVASVPASITIPAGATIGTFPITTYMTATAIPVTVTASFNGSSRSRNLTINPVGLASLVLGTYNITGGMTVPNSRVTLDAPAGPTDVVVSLSTSDPSVITLPSTVTVPVGATQSSPFFSIPTTPVSSITNVTVTASYNGINRSVNLRLNPIALNTITLGSAAVAGGNQVNNNRVSLTAPAPAGGLTVTLSASDPGVSLPPSVTVAGGATNSPYFTISTSGVSTQTVVTITASLDGINRTANLTVNPVALSSLTLGATAAVGGTTVGNNRVNLGGPAHANGAVVTLTSSDPAIAAPPPSVTVAAGATQSPAFPITTFPVSTPTSVTITAAYGGVTRTATLTVGSVALNSLTLGATSIVGGAGFGNNRVNLTGAAGTGGVVVALSTSNSSLVTVPPNITVPEGASQSTNFTIATSSVSTPTPVTITASYAGVNRSANVTLNPSTLNALTLGKAVAVGGTVVNNNRVTLNGPAGPSGVVVTLSSSDSALAPVPSTITVPSGATQSPTFNITTSNVSGQTALAITASYGGVTRTAPLTLVPASLNSLTIPATVTGGLNVNNCRVLLNGPAGPSGVVVTVSSSDPTVANPPANVTIAPGASQSPPFAIPTSGVTTQTAVTITATLNGISRANNLTANPVIPTSVGLSKTAITGGAFVFSNRVYLNAPAAPGDLAVTLTTSDPAVATVPATLIIPAGTSVSPPFAITTYGVSASTTVIIQATLNGVTRVKSLTVNP